MQQLRNHLADVVGQIDVFLESVNDLVELGQRGATFEGQSLGEDGFVDGRQSPYHPDVFFKKVWRATSLSSSHFECLSPVFAAESEP